MWIYYLCVCVCGPPIGVIIMIIRTHVIVCVFETYIYNVYGTEQEEEKIYICTYFFLYIIKRLYYHTRVSCCGGKRGLIFIYFLFG